MNNFMMQGFAHAGSHLARACCRIALALCAVLTMTCASASAAVPNVSLTQNASSIRRYDIYELTMTNPAVYANAWDDVPITAVMTAPSGKTFSVGGFSYDGLNIWKLRF